MGLFSKFKNKPKAQERNSFEILAEAFRSGDYGKTLQLAREFSDKGDPQGWNFEAMLYDAGLGVKKDPAKADRLYRKSAYAGNAAGQFEYARRILTGDGGGSEDEAIRFMKAAADQGYPESVHQLGLMYFGNYGGLEDDAFAFRCFKKASESGEKEANPFLGYCLCYGIGTGKDVQTGTMILMSSALNGSGVAEGMLEEIYPGRDWRSEYEKEKRNLESRTH